MRRTQTVRHEESDCATCRARVQVTPRDSIRQQRRMKGLRGGWLTRWSPCRSLYTDGYSSRVVGTAAGCLDNCCGIVVMDPHTMVPRGHENLLSVPPCAGTDQSRTNHEGSTRWKNVQRPGIGEPRTISCPIIQSNLSLSCPPLLCFVLPHYLGAHHPRIRGRLGCLACDR